MANEKPVVKRIVVDKNKNGIRRETTYPQKPSKGSRRPQ